MTIRNKYLLYTLLPFLLLVPLFTVYLIHQQGAYEQHRLDNKIQRINSLMKSVNEEPLRNSAYDLIEANCASIFEDEEVVGILLKDDLDIIRVNLSDSILTDTTKYLKHSIQVVAVDSFKSVTLDSFKMVYREKKSNIDIDYTRAKIDEKLATIRNGMIALMALLFVFLILIFFQIANVISKPINTIIQSLRKIDEGDLSHRMTLQNEDEFKQIQNHFNKMVHSIKEKKEELEDSNHQLVVEIHERQKATQILSNIISNIPYSVFWKDTSLKYLGCNQNFARDKERSLETIIGMDDSQLASSPQAAAFHKRTDERVMQQKRPVIGLEHSELKNGQKIVYSTSKVLLYNENKEVMGLLGIYSDITERKKEEEELRKAKETAEAANQAKSDFLANMSHEIRTPMNGIMGMAEILGDSDMKPEQKRYIELIKTSTESLLHVINDILDISKIEVGKISLDIEEVNLIALTEQIIDSFAVTAHTKGLELLCRIAPDVNMHLLTDGGRLKQILINIIGNAIKFTTKGEIFLRISSQYDREGETMLHFAIKDTGIGIPLDMRGKIFDSFTQVDTSYNREFSGTGLGLAISKRLVEMMGGKIWVESEVNVGSTFHFTIPFKYEKNQKPSYPKLPANTSVLLIEDNQSSQLVYKEMLELMGATVQQASDENTALSILTQSESKIDCILVELHFDGKSGVQLIKKAVHESESFTTPTILLTNSVDAREAKDKLKAAKDLGLGTTLVKPLKIKELYNIIQIAQRNFKPLKGKVKQVAMPIFSNKVDRPKPKQQSSSKEPQFITRRIPTTPEPTPPIETKPQKIRVLVAEDHTLNQRITRIMLQKLGYEVVIAANGQEAIDKYNNSFNLILMDIQMPVVDGVDATKAIRQKEKQHNQRIPIIALTAHAQTGDRERFIEAGMDDYISKPYKAEEFYKVIGNYV